MFETMSKSEFKAYVLAKMAKTDKLPDGYAGSFAYERNGNLFYAEPASDRGRVIRIVLSKVSEDRITTSEENVRGLRVGTNGLKALYAKTSSVIAPQENNLDIILS
ncbi:MAG: hypothetical protein J4400_02780 [Candidatus Aenigmarchaeota archaeon]|nr:hypothetical protein [Candidatus Aenigmarchaeota archaeon]